MKKIYKIFVIILSAATLGACAHIGDISVQDFKITRLSPQSLQSVYAGLDLKITNAGAAVSIKSLSGEVFYKDAPLGVFSVDDFTVPAKTTDWMPLSGSVTMDPSVSLLSILELAQGFESEKMSISFDATAAVGIAKKKIHQEKLPVSQLLAKIKN